MKAKDALAAEWELRMADTVASHAQRMAAAAASYEARLEAGRRELAAVQVPQPGDPLKAPQLALQTNVKLSSNNRS